MIPINQLTTGQKIDIALQLRDTASFFVKYYELLPKFKTQKECYDYLNAIHIEIFETEKYNSFNSFQACMYRDAKKYLKNRK